MREVVFPVLRKDMIVRGERELDGRGQWKRVVC